jgi:hypothetical protein
MNNAAGYVGRVDEKGNTLADTISRDIPNAARTSEDAIDRLRNQGVDDLDALTEAARRLAFGGSPGGIKEFAVQAKIGQEAIGDLAAAGVADFNRLKRAADRSAYFNTGAASPLMPEPYVDQTTDQTIVVQVDGQVIARAMIRGFPHVATVNGVAW